MGLNKETVEKIRKKHPGRVIPDYSKTLGIRLTKAERECIDLLAAGPKYHSISEVVRQAIRDLIDKEAREDGPTGRGTHNHLSDDQDLLGRDYQSIHDVCGCLGRLWSSDR